MLHLSRNTKANKMNEATFTFRVDEDLTDKSTNAAKGWDRTGAQLLRDFMRDFVKQQQEQTAHDAWFRREVAIGVAAGDVVPAAKAEADAAAWRLKMRTKLTGAKRVRNA